MTEEEWLGGTEPEKMLEFLGGNASERKLRLFACACCRRIWHLLADERSRTAVEVAERLAEGSASEDERVAVRLVASEVSKAAFDATANYLHEEEGDEPIHLPGFHLAAATSAASYAASYTTLSPAQLTKAVACMGAERGFIAIGVDGAARAVYHATAAADAPAADTALKGEVAAQCHLLRDIFGTPFRPVALDAAWLTPGVVELARTIYEGRAFEQMPELADALETAGCHDPDILAHCRGPGGHVRGCWVVDMILGKS
jgi:hypothetical protein